MELKTTHSSFAAENNRCLQAMFADLYPFLANLERSGGISRMSLRRDGRRAAELQNKARPEASE